MFDASDSPTYSCDQNLPCETESLLPVGEKVADRPDGAFEDGSVLKRPPHTSPLPQFFARMLPCDSTQNRQKTGGEGQHGGVQLSCCPCAFD